MFDSISIRLRDKVSQGQPYNLGFLAEALIFYKEVKLIANRWMIEDFVKRCGPDVILELVEEGYLKIDFELDEFAIYTENSNSPNERHKPAYGHITSSQTHIIPSSHSIIGQAIDNAIGHSGKSRKLGNKLNKHVQVISHNGSINDHARNDFLNPVFLLPAINQLLDHLVPEYKLEDLKFEVEKDGDFVRVNTNINFLEANNYYHTRIPKTHSTLTTGYLLSTIHSALGDLHFAQRYSSEIAADELNSKIIKLKLTKLIETRDASSTAINCFQDFIFNDSRAIAEAVNSEQRNIRVVALKQPSVISCRE